MLPSIIAKNQLLASLAHQSIRAYATGYWNKDWRPGPYPKTEAQRRAAAKKYGMIYEDYEPYPDDHTSYGDYPKLPIVSAESRDPHYNYDMDEFKRNFNEPMHVDSDMYGEDRWDRSKRLRYPLWQMNLAFLGVIGGFGILFWCGEQVKINFTKMMPKHYPGDGKVHYTFEMD